MLDDVKAISTFDKPDLYETILLFFAGVVLWCSGFK